MAILYTGIPFLALFLIFSEGNYNDFDPEIDGRELYSKHCLTCHQADGSGVRGMFPPLIRTDKVLGREDELITIIISGLKGPLEVAGETYEQEMPAAGYLTDQEIAAILTYVRNSWGNKASPVTPTAVAKVRSQIKKTATSDSD
ncbi:MAG: cytochrome c [Bacteroidales bacterium]